MVEKHSRDSHTHRRTGDIQDPTYAGRNVAVKEGLRRLPRDGMSTPTNGIPTKPRNSAKPRSGRVQSYQPSAEVILFLPEEKGSNGSSSSSRLTTPGSTNGGKVASSRLDLAKDHSSTSRTEMRRPSSVHVWSQRVSRVTATKLAAKAKGDLPPIPSARQSRSPAPLSTVSIPSARTAHRSRYSKLLPPTPIPVPGTPKDSTSTDIFVLQRDKVLRGNLRRSRRDGTDDTPALEALARTRAAEQTGAKADDTVRPNSAPRRSSLKSIGRKVSRKLSIPRRRKNDGDGDRTSRVWSRLPRLAIPGRMSRCPSTASAYSVVIQPTTPAGRRKSIWGSSKRFLELDAHVTEEELPTRIKRILQRRGADASEPSQAHVNEPSVNGELYHSDLSLAIEVLRGEPIVEEFSMTSPVD